MAAKNYKVLNYLNDVDENSVVLAKVIRKWMNHIIDKPLAILSMDLILEDEEGNRIHASIPKQIMNSFEKKIDEFKNVENSKKLTFTRTTEVKFYYDSTESIHVLNFTTIEDLLSESISIDTCIDDVSVQDITKINGKLAKRLKINQYDNNDNKISMTLWDAYAISLRSFVDRNQGNAPVIIVLQFAMYKHYDGEPGVCNALSITKLFINEGIGEIEEFQKRFKPMFNF
ncbi:uncharacterized protein LOC143618748 [Bidens hawaiensis]|uniref:uncharacterized protein LOC143618748 n=1 Tax=Bidens hawaiensis TaxID=980011 RepID=UPI00404AD19B